MRNFLVIHEKSVSSSSMPANGSALCASNPADININSGAHLSIIGRACSFTAARKVFEPAPSFKGTLTTLLNAPVSCLWPVPGYKGI